MVFDKLKKALFAEDRELGIDEAISFFEEQREDAIDSLEEELETYRASFRSGIEELEDSLDSLQSYDDPEGRSVIEDVLGNIYSKKKKLVDGLELPESPDRLQERLEEFVEQFQTLTMKEKEVVKHAGEEPDSVFSRLREIKRLVEEFESFLDGRYLSVRRYERLQDLVTDIGQLKEEREELEERSDGIAPDAAREAAGEAQEKLDSLEQDEGWERLDELKKEKQRLENQLTELKKEIQQPFSRMERGLKKILYRIENGDIDLATPYKDVLEGLRGGEMENDAETFTALEKLEEIVEERDIVSGRYEKTFLQALEDMKKVPDREEEMEGLRQNIESLSKKITGFGLKDKRQELEQRRDTLEKKLEQKKGKVEALRQEAERKKEEIREKVREMEEIMNQEFLDDIELLP